MSANSIKLRNSTGSGIGEGTGANSISHLADDVEKFKMVFD